MKPLLAVLLLGRMLVGQSESCEHFYDTRLLTTQYRPKTICVGFANRLCDEVQPANWRTIRYLNTEPWEGRVFFTRKFIPLPALGLYGRGSRAAIYLKGKQSWEGLHAEIFHQNYVGIPEPEALRGGRTNCPDHRSDQHMVCPSGYTEPTVKERQR